MTSEIDTQTDFKSMWDQVEQRFYNRTKKSLRSLDKNSLDEVLNKWEAKYGKKDTNEDGHQTQIILKNTLLGFKVLGSLVADGASQVSVSTLLDGRS
jgi:hypothetical protein